MMSTLASSQEPVFALLAEPATHGGAVIKRVDTHAGVVFLAGERALKLKRAVQLNGTTGLCITKLDVLDGLPTVRLGVGYRFDGRLVDILPYGADAVGRCEPVYEEFKGWSESTFGIREWSELPENARRYLERLAEVLGVPIDLVSTGPDREQTIVLRHPFRN